MVATGELSVMPKPSIKVQPVTFFQRSATARCTAMPPPKLIFRCEKSTSAKPGVFNSPLNKVLTPVIAVNGVFDSSLTKPGMSRGFVISTLMPPNLMKTRQLQVSAKM